MDAKHLMHFQSETSIFKFLRRSVDGANMTTLTQGGKERRIVNRGMHYKECSGKDNLNIDVDSSVFTYLTAKTREKHAV